MIRQIHAIELFGSRQLVRDGDGASWIFTSGAAAPAPLSKLESMFINAALRAGVKAALEHRVTELENDAPGVPAVAASQDAIDAARYRHWRDVYRKRYSFQDPEISGEQLDACIDAAIDAVRGRG